MLIINSDIDVKLFQNIKFFASVFITLVTRSANAVKSEDMRGESKHLDLRRRLHCAAYSALIAVISRTQTDVKFYNGFLFTENPLKVIRLETAAGFLCHYLTCFMPEIREIIMFCLFNLIILYASYFISCYLFNYCNNYFFRDSFYGKI